MKCLKRGFDVKEAYKIVDNIIENKDYKIYLNEFVTEHLIRKINRINKKPDYDDFVKQTNEDIKSITNIKHLSFPKQVSLYLTSACQLNCIFCFYDNKRHIFKKSVSADNWIKLINDLKKYGVMYISLLGGEPTLYKDINKILKCLDDLKIKSTITTNGYMMKQSTFNIICNSKYITPTISLQSINDYTNKYLMGINSFYADNIVKRFIDNGKVPRINTVITNQTIGELCDMVDYCVKNKITEFYTDVYVENSGNENLKSHTYAEYKDIKSQIEKYIKKKGYEDKINYQLQGCLLYSAYNSDEEYANLSSYETIKYGCEGGHTKIEIMPNGDVYPCVMFSHSQFDYDNAFKKNIKDIWYNSKYLNKLRNNKCEYSSCLNCKYYKFCNGGCPAIILNSKKSIIKEADDRCQILISKK